MTVAKIFLFFSCITIFCSCKKNDTSGVPTVSVDFTLYLTEPSNSSLNGVGNHVYISGYGVKGVIIYRETQDIFLAFDRACSYDYNVAASRIDVDSVNLAYIDRNCGSKFNLLNGEVQQGPATHAMKRYQADFDGTSIVHVHN